MKIEELKKGLIVSCQAMADEPMYGSEVMAMFAQAAQMGGAVAVRINSVPDILAVKKKIDLPVIGLLKRDYPDSLCRITPTMREVQAVYLAGAEIVALDCTKNPRPNGEKLETLLNNIRREFPDLLIMADISTLEEGIRAYEYGVDMVGTTCAPGTPGMEFAEPSNELVAQLCQQIKVPVIAEGRYFGSATAIKAFELGAHNVVIGAGVTRPQVITRKIVKEITDAKVL